MGREEENRYVTDYLEQDPYLVNIYEGYGFAKDYGSARGHYYTLTDVDLGRSQYLFTRAPAHSGTPC